MRKILFSLIIAATGLVFAQDAAPKDNAQQAPAAEGTTVAPKGDKPDHPARPNHQGAPGREQMLKRLESENQAIIAKYDTDKDGKLSDAEMAVAKAELDMDKLTKEQNELRQKMRQARTFALFNEIDTNHDGVLSDEEKAEAGKKVMEFNRHLAPQQRPQQFRGGVRAGLPPMRGTLQDNKPKAAPAPEAK